MSIVESSLPCTIGASTNSAHLHHQFSSICLLPSHRRPMPSSAIEMEPSPGNNKRDDVKLPNKLAQFLQGLSPTTMESSSPSSINDTPPVERWSRDFMSLINDSEGVEVFKQFMEEAGLGDMLNFWFACRGLRQPEKDKFFDRERLINAILKKFIIKSNNIELSEACRKNLMDLYRKLLANRKQRDTKKIDNEEQNDETGEQTQSVFNEHTANAFDQAAMEVEQKLSGTIYQSFLKSKNFTQYISNLDGNQSRAESTKEESQEFKEEDQEEEIKLEEYNSNVSGRVMPTIDEVGDEDSEATITNLSDQTGTTQKLEDKLSQLNLNHHQNCPSTQLPNRKSTWNTMLKNWEVTLEPASQQSAPYHVRYTTVVCNSKRDSEVESISSTSTSGTSSLGGYDLRDRRGRRGLIHPISNKRNTLHTNNNNNKGRGQSSSLPDPTKDTETFAKLLIEKLVRVRQQQEAEIKFKNTLLDLERDSPSLSQRESGVGQHSNSKTKVLGQALKDACKGINLTSIDNDSGQAILDKHFAQVFNETPNSATPTATSANNGIEYPANGAPRYHYPSGESGTRSGPAGSLPPPSPLSSGQFFGTNRDSTNSIQVTFKFSNEECPYKITFEGTQMTLGTFKIQIPNKPGIQHFYFKRKCTEKERREYSSEFVHERISDDKAILPQCDGKIFAIVEVGNIN